MKIAEIYSILDSLAPFSEAEEWDNSGLLVGSFEDSFDKIYASLDLDSDLAKSLDENSLLITHHPLIFGGLKRLDTSKYPANLLEILVKKDIKLISMHTNFDKFLLNKFIIEEILGFEVIKTDGFINYFEVDTDFDEFARFIKEKFEIKNLRVVKTKDRIKKVALCSGSGMDLAKFVEADLYLTGDIRYHAGLECLENNLSLMDINHFESEKFFGTTLAKNLQNFDIKVIITNSKNPFTYK